MKLSAPTLDPTAIPSPVARFSAGGAGVGLPHAATDPRKIASETSRRGGDEFTWDLLPLPYPSTIIDKRGEGFVRFILAREAWVPPSPVGAAWVGGDILLAVRRRSEKGAKRDELFVAHRGLGISDHPMSDFDDVGFIAEYGLAHSILHR